MKKIPIKDLIEAWSFLDIILKGSNWEFRTKGMPLDKLAEIQEFMVKYR